MFWKSNKFKLKMQVIKLGWT